ncbi:sugar phosphate isomerase/epimerase family protein [Actinophytocola sediminis]
MSPVPGLVSVTFRQLSVPEIVALVAAAGLRAVEWGGDVHVQDRAAARETAARCADAGIEVAAFGSYYRAGAGAPFDDWLATAVALGAPRIRIWAGELGSAREPDRRGVVADIARVAALAATEGVTICLEYHANTLTDTLESTVDLLAEVPAVRPYWQPPIGVSAADALTQARTLAPVTAHVFAWSDTGARLPLAAGEPLWTPVLSTMEDGYALLEFVRDDDPAAFAEDAATLLGWLGQG